MANPINPQTQRPWTDQEMSYFRLLAANSGNPDFAGSAERYLNAATTPNAQTGITNNIEGIDPYQVKGGIDWAKFYSDQDYQRQVLAQKAGEDTGIMPNGKPTEEELKRQDDIRKNPLNAALYEQERRGFRSGTGNENPMTYQDPGGTGGNQPAAPAAPAAGGGGAAPAAAAARSAGGAVTARLNPTTHQYEFIPAAGGPAFSIDRATGMQLAGGQYGTGNGGQSVGVGSADYQKSALGGAIQDLNKRTSSLTPEAAAAFEKYDASKGSVPGGTGGMFVPGHDGADPLNFRAMGASDNVDLTDTGFVPTPAENPDNPGDVAMRAQIAQVASLGDPNDPDSAASKYAAADRVARVVQAAREAVSPPPSAGSPLGPANYGFGEGQAGHDAAVAFHDAMFNKKDLGVDPNDAAHKHIMGASAYEDYIKNLNEQNNPDAETFSGDALVKGVDPQLDALRSKQALQDRFADILRRTATLEHTAREVQSRVNAANGDTSAITNDPAWRSKLDALRAILQAKTGPEGLMEAGVKGAWDVFTGKGLPSDTNEDGTPVDPVAYQKYQDEDLISKAMGMDLSKQSPLGTTNAVTGKQQSGLERVLDAYKPDWYAHRYNLDYQLPHYKGGGQVMVGGAPHWIVDAMGKPVAALSEDGKNEKVKGKGGVEVIPQDPKRKAAYEANKNSVPGAKGGAKRLRMPPQASKAAAPGGKGAALMAALMAAQGAGGAPAGGQGQQLPPVTVQPPPPPQINPMNGMPVQGRDKGGRVNMRASRTRRGSQAGNSNANMSGRTTTSKEVNARTSGAGRDDGRSENGKTNNGRPPEPGSEVAGKPGVTDSDAASVRRVVRAPMSAGGPGSATHAGGNVDAPTQGVLSAVGQHAGKNDPRDLNGDGVISIADVIKSLHSVQPTTGGPPSIQAPLTKTPVGTLTPTNPAGRPVLTGPTSVGPTTPVQTMPKTLPTTITPMTPTNPAARPVLQGPTSLPQPQPPVGGTPTLPVREPTGAVMPYRPVAGAPMGSVAPVFRMAGNGSVPGGDNGMYGGFTGTGSDLDTRGWQDAFANAGSQYHTGNDAADRWKWLAAGRPNSGVDPLGPNSKSADALPSNIPGVQFSASGGDRTVGNATAPMAKFGFDKNAPIDIAAHGATRGVKGMPGVQVDQPWKIAPRTTITNGTFGNQLLQSYWNASGAAPEDLADRGKYAAPGAAGSTRTSVGRTAYA